MNITLSVEENVLQVARERADAMGTSVNQLVRDYLSQLAGKTYTDDLWDEFERLSQEGHGNSNGWKFNREEIHERG